VVWFWILLLPFEAVHRVAKDINSFLEKYDREYAQNPIVSCRHSLTLILTTADSSSGHASWERPLWKAKEVFQPQFEVENYVYLPNPHGHPLSVWLARNAINWWVRSKAGVRFTVSFCV